MKAWLVAQEGPGAGQSYPLDPVTQPVLSVGRSAQCQIALRDGRASRHHADIRWDGRQWSVVDRGSTNGTFVNGAQVRQPHSLREGDRVTIGETTMVLRLAGGGTPAAAPGAKPVPYPPQAAMPAPDLAYEPEAGGTGSGGMSTGKTAFFWLVQGIVAAAVVLLASGAMLPWLRVTGSLSQDLGPLLQGVTGAVSSIFGQDAFFEFTQEISGLEGFGKLTLAVAVISAVAMIVDIFFIRGSVVPGIIYLLSGLLAMGAMASDLMNFYQLYQQASSWSLLFGIQLADVIEVFSHFIDMQITPLPGLPLTVLGLVLLLVGGIGRIVVALLDRGR
ncbi:FHA domain-containing protein [Chloroflexota bacterium]